MKGSNPEISVILPCRNEEEGLAFCIQEIKKTIAAHHLSAEIIVSDSSTDNSPLIAKREEVVLLPHGLEGYGAAYLEAFTIAKGTYIFMADADASYSFAEIPVFISQLKNGFDMVIGNRFAGTMYKKSMPFLRRYVGNPALSFLLQIIFKASIHDSQCGMRAIRRDTLAGLKLQTTGMEFASEMIIKALKSNLKIKELAIDYFPRKGASKLRPFADGLRHIQLMLNQF